MKIRVFLIFFCSMITLQIFSQSGYSDFYKAEETDNTVDFIMMNLEIKHTLEEHKKQTEMKKNEDKNTVLEANNKWQWNKLKEKISKIQKRLSIVDFAIQSIPVGITITEQSKSIKKNQQKILEELKSFPPNMSETIENELKFLDDLQMTMRLLIGIITSYGEINQMEKSERKIITDYALAEVNRLATESSHILFLIREARYKMQLQQANFNSFIERDKALIKSIIKNVNEL